MGFMSKDNPRDLSRKVARFACESAAEIFQGTDIVERESPDYLLQTPLGPLGLEVTDLRPHQQVVASDMDGFYFLNSIYDAWLENRDLQRFSIHLHFRHEDPTKLKTPRKRDHPKVLSEIVTICRHYGSTIRDGGFRKICFRPDECFVVDSGSIQDKISFQNNIVSLFIESSLLFRHDSIITLMPHSNLTSGPRGDWPERLREAILAKAKLAPDYRNNLPKPCGLGLLINGGTSHHGHFLGDEDELARAAQISIETHTATGRPFDCVFIAGPHYVGNTYQDVATAVPWNGLI